MGHKSHPNGLRLGVIRGWESKWYAEDNFADLLYEDITLSRYLMKRFEHASLSKVGIERTVKKVNVNLFTARPGIVIGKKGEELDRVKSELQFLTGKEIFISVHEIKRPETDAKLVAENIARQLEKRISFRRAMKQAMQRATRLGAKGIKCMCAGRLGGAEIARSETYHEGTIPLQTLRADIEYGFAEANTTYGKVGCKVWIYKGEVLNSTLRSAAVEQPARRDRRDGDRRDRRDRKPFNGERRDGERRDRRPFNGERRDNNGGERRPYNRPEGGNR